MFRRLSALALSSVLALAAACGDSTAPRDEPSTFAAAQELTHLADSLAANGGDPAEVGAFRGLASAVSASGRLSTVTISVDGAASEFLGMADQLDAGPCPTGALCSDFAQLGLRSFVAWQKSDPRRVVQLIAPTETAYSLGATQPITGLSETPSRPFLVFYDGSGQLYAGTSTAQAVTLVSVGAPCETQGPQLLAIWAVSACTQAEFSVALAGTLTPVAYMTRVAAPAPSHTVAMSTQQVHGVRLVEAARCTTCPDSVGWPVVSPPIPRPPADSLTASLAVSVGADVTFSFTVTNATSAPATIQFPSTQQYDFRVWDASGKLLWRWGGDKTFAATVTSRTLAAGESATYVEHWSKPAAGTYRALAYLTSSSHGAASYATFQVP